jgi:hypothetical protein
MIIVDTSVWIGHFRQEEPRLLKLIEQGSLLMHPFVIGEIALGSLARREATIVLLSKQDEAPVATLPEVLRLIERERLHGLGIGYVDAHLLASARLADATLWTRDKRLDLAAGRLGVRAGIERRH